MDHFSLQDAPEVFVSTTKTSKAVSRALAAGKLRRLGSRLYTTNLTENPESLVRRHLWEIVVGYFPGGLIADRTALEQRPAADGSVFLAAAKPRDIELPGVTLRARRNGGPQPGDFPIRENLFCMSTARALLENTRPSRGRIGVARTFARAEIEAWLERFLRDSGEERLNALRDQIKQLAPTLALETGAAQLNNIIGALLGTQETGLVAPVAKARQRGAPFDPRRIGLFEKLHDGLRLFPPEPARRWQPMDQAAVNQAFFEAYFSNFIEGTEFAVEEAAAIVFDGAIPWDRPADAHDILGTFRLVSDINEMKRVADTGRAFVELLRHRHRLIMAGRPEQLPGIFKERTNQFGAVTFVAPEDVLGTLSEGFRIHRRLTEPLHRAIFMMFLVSEVHPFADGNGRLARVMMNAELAAADQARILIPIVYRSNYIAALRALSTNAWPEPVIRTLGFAQRYAAAIPWDDIDVALSVLRRTNAFVRSEEGDELGIRLRIPEAADLAPDEIDDLAPPRSR